MRRANVVSADLFKKPRQIPTIIHQRRQPSLSSSLCTVLNKKFINSPPHRIMTNDPVLITSVGDPHQQNGSQKWASSLATAQQTAINGGAHHHTPHHKHTSSTSSFYPKDKVATMGISQLDRGMLILDTTLSYELRNKLGIRGVMPPAVDTPDIQIERCLSRIRAKTTNLEKYVIPE